MKARMIKFFVIAFSFSASLLYSQLAVSSGVKHEINDESITDTTKHQKFRYGGMHQIGLLFGDKRSSTCFNFINGIRFSRFFTGIGFDAQLNRNFNNYLSSYYVNSTINTSAVYADLRYYINKKKNFFAVVNGGVNLVTENLESNVNQNYKKRAGYYTSAGLGFKAKLGKEVFYSFDLSYSIKQTRFNYNYLNFINEWQADKYDIRQYSLLLRMGVELF